MAPPCRVSRSTLALEETIDDPEAPLPGQELDRRETIEGLRHAIGTLPEKERTVLSLYYYEELNLRPDRRNPARDRIAGVADPDPGAPAHARPPHRPEGRRMTRRRLWSLTALACTLLAVPGLPRLSPARLRLESVRWPEIHPLHLESLALPSAEVVAGAILLLVMATLVVIRRYRRTAPELAVVMARRGSPVTAIARRTRLSQDAVRDLLGGEPVAVSTGGMGRFFRRRNQATRSPPAPLPKS